MLVVGLLIVAVFVVVPLWWIISLALLLAYALAFELLRTDRESRRCSKVEVALAVGSGNVVVLVVVVVIADVEFVELVRFGELACACDLAVDVAAGARAADEDPDAAEEGALAKKSRSRPKDVADSARDAGAGQRPPGENTHKKAMTGDVSR